MVDILKSYIGVLVKAEKAEDGTRTAVWSFVREGEVDRDGDEFAAGSIRMSKERGTVTSYQHQNRPAGTFTFSREGSDGMAHVEFLPTQAGEETYEYVKAMDAACEFSFRGKGEKFEWTQTGIYYTDVDVYETSPVLRGGGKSTKLSSISKEVSPMDPELLALLEKSAATSADAIAALVKSHEDAMANQLQVHNDAAKAAEEAHKAEIEELVKRLSPPEEPKLFAKAKSFAFDEPVMELTKRIFADEQLIKAMMDGDGVGGRGKVQKRVPDSFDVIKATLTTASTIGYSGIRPTLARPANVLDVCYMEPYNAEVYRMRVQANPTVGVTALDTAAETAAVITPTDLTMRQILASIPVANNAITSDPSVLASTGERLMMQARRAFQTQILAGDGTGQNFDSFAKAGIGITTAAIAANTNILSGGNANSLYARVLGLMDGGAESGYVVATAADGGKIHGTLVNQHSALPASQEFPVGNVIGWPVLVNGAGGDAIMLVGPLGDPAAHTVPVKPEMMVEFDMSEEFSLNNTVVRVVLYAQSAISNPAKFFRPTTTGNYRVDQ